MQRHEIRARVTQLAAALNEIKIELAELQELEERLDASDSELEQPCPLRVIRGGNAA